MYLHRKKKTWFPEISSHVSPVFFVAFSVMGFGSKTQHTIGRRFENQQIGPRCGSKTSMSLRKAVTMMIFFPVEKSTPTILDDDQNLLKKSGS